MTRLKALLLSALLLIPLNALHAADAPAEKPNVIVVLTDDQGYGDLSCTGNPVIKTPNMDRLAREGVQFANFHVDSYCSPTRSALMTGRYSHRVGGWGTICGRNMLRDDEVTMADVFRHNGYRTGHFGKWHLGTNYPYRPMDRGFDEWLGHGDGGTGCTTDYWGNDRVNDTCIHNGRPEPIAGFETDVFFDAARRFIRAEKGRPFFAYLALYNPHSPCSIPDPAWTAPYQGKVPPRVANFYAAIASVDRNLGQLRAFLKDEGLSENTLLVFASDNGTADGEGVFNAGMRGKKGSPYDGGHRVPCFLYWPAGGFDKPMTVDRLTAHIDLLPTLVDLCGMQMPRAVRFDGVSLRPLLADPKADWPDRTLVLGTVHNSAGPNPPLPARGRNCSVMTDRWRLVNDQELYDMTADPGQTKDVAARQPAVVRQLRAAYETYWVDVSAKDAGWRGRPIIGAPQAQEVEMCAEDWYPTKGNCPWNQGDVADGAAAFGHWTVRFAEAGAYRIEVRRWPREADAPIAGIPAAGKTPDAWLNGKPVHGLLYGGTPKALPIVLARLKVGASVQESAVESQDKSKVFTVQVDAGPADIEATLLGEGGKPLCGAYYVSVRKN